MRDQQVGRQKAARVNRPPHRNASAREKKRTHATGGHPSVTNTMPVTRTGHHPNPTATGLLPPRPHRTVPRGCLPTSYQPAQGARPWVKVLKTPFQFRPDAFDRESHQLVENLRCSLQYSRARLCCRTQAVVCQIGRQFRQARGSRVGIHSRQVRGPSSRGRDETRTPNWLRSNPL